MIVTDNVERMGSRSMLGSAPEVVAKIASRSADRDNDGAVGAFALINYSGRSGESSGIVASMTKVEVGIE